MRSQAELGEPLVAHYELAQSVYAKAKVNVHEEDKVCTRTVACTAHAVHMCWRHRQWCRAPHAHAHVHCTTAGLPLWLAYIVITMRTIAW